MTNSFSGIRPADAPAFIAAQLVGAFLATLLFQWLMPSMKSDSFGVFVNHHDGLEI
ncbi:hypothetical protein P8936_15135 [Edaphobacter paludis]|uniref:Uncharacterized protein n=1 Tax=Edaphobacter paludis TaxID=3035702 RepID=A0AAU7DDD0_9BACT